jgi:endonuclease/exonuclease/phosphatase family metal-dependent hydrolase
MNLQERQTTRLAEWNIESGGFDGYDNTSPLPHFLPEIIEGVRSFHADFVTLVDTFRWDSLYSQEQLQTMFGYKHAYCINLNDDRLKKLGHNNGITVLSNSDTVEFQTVSLGTRDAIKTSLKIDEKPVDMFSVYLDDVAEKRRKQQLTTLMQHIEQGKHTIIIGDFNSIADRDTGYVQKTFQRIYRYLPRRLKHRFYSVESKIAHRGTIQLLESHGFVDMAAQNVQPTTPTKKFYQLISPFLRFDYAFGTPNIVVASTQVVHGDLFNRTSDHYPFMLDINVK